MTTFGDTPSEWLDDELRRIPLPEGMMSRLRALAALSDEMLDAELRNVAVPGGFFPRLRRRVATDHGSPVRANGESTTIDDVTLDRALRDVPVPHGLASRLSAVSIERALPLSEEKLRDVPLPEGLMERLAHTALWAAVTDPDIPVAASTELAPHSKVAAAMARYATRPAALVMMVAALSACYLLAMGTVLRSTYLDSPLTTTNVAVGREWEPELFEQPVLQLRSGPLAKPLPVDARNIAGQLRVPWPHEPPVWKPEFLPEFNHLDTVIENVMLGANSGETPRPVTVAGPMVRGLAPSWKDPELLLALLKEGRNPAVPLTPTMNLAADAAKLTCRVPTVVSTDSFDQTLALLGSYHLRGSERQAALRWLQAEVRPEEFLAAMSYGFPPAAPGSVELRTAGGASPFGSSGQRLLQVGVVAGDVPPRSAQPCHLTLLVDCSSSMSRNGNLDRVSRAVAHFSRQLRSADRLSLVAFRNGEPEVLLEGAGAQQRAAMDEAVAAIAPAQHSNLVNGLRQAILVAKSRGPEGALRRRIVVLSDTDAELTDPIQERLRGLLRQSAAADISVWAAALAEESEPSELLRQMASGLGGRCEKLDSTLRVDRFLTEALRDQSCTVAEDVHLSVTLNPKTVKSYRLIGHEATSVLGVHTAELDMKLCAGDVCTGLFEIQLHDDGDDLVGTVEVTWRKPQQSGLERATRRISRWQLPDSLLETPPSVQTAALAAETAEILRPARSAASRGRSWPRVRQVAAEVHPQVSQQTDFRRLMELVDRAEKWGVR